MGRTFSPPVSGYGPTFRADADRVTQALWGHFRGAPEPTSVIKSGSTYTDQDYVYSDDIDAADIFYQGGHRYSVDQAEAEALTAAGYDVYLLDEHFSAPADTIVGYGGFWHGNGVYDPDTSTFGNSSLDASFTPYVDSQGRLRTPETTNAGAGGAGYSWGYLDAEPTRVGHDMILATPTVSRSGLPGVATIISNVQDTTPLTIAIQSVHVVTLGYGVGIFLLDNDSEPFTAEAIHLFTDHLLEADDETIHSTEVIRDGDLCTVVCPDGFELEVEDPQVSALWGSTVLYEQLWGPGYPGAEPMTTRAWAVA